MSAITTHILDTAHGHPAANVPIQLFLKANNDSWRLLGEGKTDEDGRLKTLLGASALQKGTYKINFNTGAYFASLQKEGFYPEVSIQFIVRDENQHYHVPLLLNPFGFSTYRGS